MGSTGLSRWAQPDQAGSMAPRSTDTTGCRSRANQGWSALNTSAADGHAGDRLTVYRVDADTDGKCERIALPHRLAATRGS